MHTIIPNLFVMWDDKIRRGILGESEDKYGEHYAYEFLPRMQNEFGEAISSYMEDGFSREEVVRKLSEDCDNRTLPKLIDQHNYVIYTLRKQL